jgi:autotransporter-associated beta strand protein
MNTRIAKTLLVAAALVGATASSAKAYDLFGSGWNYTEPDKRDSDWTFVGPNYEEVYWLGSLDSRLVDAGVYRNASARLDWRDNYYFFDGTPEEDYARARLGTGAATGPTTASFDYFTPAQDGTYESGYYILNTSLGTTNIAIGQYYVGLGVLLEGEYDTDVIRAITVFERTVQVARTGSGDNGANAFSAFEGDNSQTLLPAFYNASFVGRNVLPVATDGEGSVDLAGSYVRVGDISLGFGSAEGLFAKDGGWLDIRGDLTLGAGGTIYIRDGEITSNVYTQYYTPGTLDTLGVLAIDSGILSVRSHFAQDMVAVWDQTLGFRDGAVNNSRLILAGVGYGFDGEGFGDASNGGGALRSITGENIQNGNISIVADGEGFLDGALIGTDLGSKLTINGSINGLNSLGSQGGADVIFNSVGNTVVNGALLGGINDVEKYGAGELVLAAGNNFTGEVLVEEGSLRITHSGALSGGDSDTFVADGASLVLDHATGLSLAENIHILGDGLAGVGGAIHNLSGANVTTGDVIVGTDGEGDYSATITVAASSSLTVGNIQAGEPDSYHTLTVDVDGADATAGAFTATGVTNTLDRLVKNGTGTATLTTLSNDFDTATVNDGKLIVLGSESTLESPFDAEFTKDGAGTAEFRGSHFYSDFDVDAGTLNLFGNVTLVGSVDNGDFDLGYTDLEADPVIQTSGTLNVESGATLTHISSDGEGGSYTNGFDIRNASVLDVKTGGTVQLNAAEIDLDDTGKVIVAGTLSTTDAIYANDQSTVEVLSGGVINAYIEAQDNSTVTIRTGGTINGDVETYNDAEFLVESGATHDGSYIAYGLADIVVNGTIGAEVVDVDSGELLATGHVFDLSGSARLSGSGVLTGSLLQTDGTVAPGNSVETLTVLGDYTNTNGVLEIEIGGTAGAGIDPNGNDQLAVGGTVTLGGTSVLEFKPYNVDPDTGLTFEPDQGNPAFQILATTTGGTLATVGTFNTVTNGTDTRVLFDHSTGKAYGTGLDLAARETFADYGDNGNRREIGRALWMESIARDNSTFADRNFESQGIQDSDLDLPITDPDTESLGLKAFILTSNAVNPDPLGATPEEIAGDLTQVGTDLGAAAVSVLTAGDVGAALDALSPEVYVGFTELNTRLNRNFSLLGATGRRSGDEKKWGFNLGYSGEQLTSNGTSAYNQFKAGSNTAYLTADLALGSQVHLNLSLGMDDGDVRARGFDGDTDSALAGIGISYTTSESFARIDLGAAFSSTDITAVRQGGVANLDEQDGYAVSLRVTFLPKDPPLKPAVAGKPAESPRLSLIPYIGLSVGSTTLDSFVESEAADTVQLGVAGYDRDSLVGEVGMGIEYALGANTTLTGIVAYEHEFDSSGETDLTAEFAEDGVTDTRFGIRSDGIGEGLFRVGLGLRQKLGAATSVGISYDALLGSGIDSGHHLKADVSFRF